MLTAICRVKLDLLKGRDSASTTSTTWQVPFSLEQAHKLTARKRSYKPESTTSHLSDKTPHI